MDKEEERRRRKEEGRTALEVEYERKMILEFVYILRIVIFRLYGRIVRY